MIERLSLCCVFVVAFASSAVAGENRTDVSLAWKDPGTQVARIESETGNLYDKVKHHGPAVENEWLGLRMYFDFKTSIDVYNKTRPGLELAKAGWYPTPEQQKEGWGSDQYKVGRTGGLGGIRLWDGEKAVFLDPVSRRTARVFKEASLSSMEMLSEQVPYRGRKVDILVRVTVYSGRRAAKVEAFALGDEPVQFVSGVNYHPTTQTRQGRNYLATWGLHPEDVAATPMKIGAGIVFDPEDYAEIRKEEKEYLLISKPAKYLATWITSSCEKEPELNSLDAFVASLEGFLK